MSTVRHRYDFPELEGMPTRDLVRGALQATGRLAQIEIALAKDEMREQLRIALRACIWGVFAFGCLILSLAAVLIAASIISDSQVLVAGSFAAVTAVMALVTGSVAYRTRPRHLLVRTRERLEREATLLGRHTA